MELRYETISFLSDYGTGDEFVGVVKSVIRQIAPMVGVVDITHEIPPHNIRGGGLALARSAQYLCPGVVLAVVDPGVGTDRRAVAVEVGGGMSVLVGPDNGLLAAAVGMVGGASRAVELTNEDYHLASPGPTFAGRDIFAPVAAHLCAGVTLDELGTDINPAGLVPGVLPLSHDSEDGLEAEVLWIDRFGNCQLNVGPDEITIPDEDPVGLKFGDTLRRATRVRTYADLKGTEIGLVVDSYGLMAVTMNQVSASVELGLGPSDAVTLVSLDDEPAPTVTTRVEISPGTPESNVQENQS